MSGKLDTILKLTVSKRHVPQPSSFPPRLTPEGCSFPALLMCSGGGTNCWNDNSRYNKHGNSRGFSLYTFGFGIHRAEFTDRTKRFADLIVDGGTFATSPSAVHFRPPSKSSSAAEDFARPSGWQVGETFAAWKFHAKSFEPKKQVRTMRVAVVPSQSTLSNANEITNTQWTTELHCTPIAGTFSFFF